MKTLKHGICSLLCLAVLLFGITSLAQDEVDSKIIEGIKDHDISAMSEAAASGNSAYIPHLRPKLRSRDFVEAEAAKIALIKLHDQETMQRMYCEVKAFGGADYAFAINELPKIGGWFSISLLRAAIVENDQIHSRVKWPPSDAIVAEPASYAVDALPKLIKNPDRPKSDVPGADERLSALSWVKWIDDHQETLSKLEPTGNDYTFTDDACKKKR